MTNLQISAPPGVPQIVTTVDFDAPRMLVFRAFMEPDLLAQWLGPRRVTMTIDEFDPRDGGRYRYSHHDPEGNTYTFHGVFHGEPTLERRGTDLRVRGRARARLHGYAQRSRSETAAPTCRRTRCTSPSRTATP